MGQPLIVKQASDLVSKFVGETEQNMAAMFKEATEEKAVLLLDEADSFLLDRRGAQRSYEVTEVNEMLQQMERHDGVFICTTNLLDRIDQAALRRFTFKIRFKPLTPEQRERMFVTEALDGQAERLTERACAGWPGWSNWPPATSPPSSARPTSWRPSSRPTRIPGAARSRAPHQARGARAALDGVCALSRQLQAGTTGALTPGYRAGAAARHHSSRSTSSP
jgi:hypothetical protein